MCVLLFKWHILNWCLLSTVSFSAAFPVFRRWKIWREDSYCARQFKYNKIFFWVWINTDPQVSLRIARPNYNGVLLHCTLRQAFLLWTEWLPVLPWTHHHTDQAVWVEWLLKVGWELDPHSLQTILTNILSAHPSLTTVLQMHNSHPGQRTVEREKRDVQRQRWVSVCYCYSVSVILILLTILLITSVSVTVSVTLLLLYTFTV